ncbi:DUF3304 domain-containing protein [Massilia sp. PAMC28688]|uniref:DUF3304 domain-containing protein n=1 Tax=Massilia sp. PAMC28688 TaxID=2861283 RepID=UPI001C62CBE4|nr:DUF3304 domain-containing protein [Massilia sp. PAMC28688]
MNNSRVHVWGTPVVVSLLSLVAGCEPGDSENRSVASVKPVSLSIVGFNYTNRPINEFFVNEIGGGNLHLSSPADGGGGSVCCFDYSPAYGKRPVEIRWTVGACLYNTRRDRFGEKFTDIHYYFRTVQAPIAKYPSNPHFLEVHFYPDNKVEVALTEKLSSPRLILAETRGNLDSSEHCENDKKPN